MAAPKVKGEKCPKCKTVNIPSSTLFINDRTGTYIGTKIKVSSRIMKKHWEIRFICSNCTYEW